MGLYKYILGHEMTALREELAKTKKLKRYNEMMITALSNEMTKMRERLASEEKVYKDQVEAVVRVMSEQAEAELRRELKPLREKLAVKDEAEAALRKKLAVKDEAETALHREVKALREKVEVAVEEAEKASRKKLEAAELALRKKGEEVEGVYRTFREVLGVPATPQRSSDATTPSTNDVRSGKFERDYRPPNPGSRGGVPYLPGNPQTHADEAWDEHVKRVSGGDHHGEWYSG